MLWRIEVKNPINKFIENYLLCADSEKSAITKLKREFPDFEIREVFSCDEDLIIKM